MKTSTSGNWVDSETAKIETMGVIPLIEEQNGLRSKEWPTALPYLGYRVKLVIFHSYQPLSVSNCL